MIKYLTCAKTQKKQKSKNKKLVFMGILRDEKSKMGVPKWKYDMILICILERRKTEVEV